MLMGRSQLSLAKMLLVDQLCILSQLAALDYKSWRVVCAWWMWQKAYAQHSGLMTLRVLRRA
jgi:hypothetical protein